MAEQEKREVVILDEETKTLMSLFDRIYEQGFETIGVSTPDEAVRAVARRKPDLLIDHLRAKGSGGLDLIERIRKLSPGTHIILLGDPPSDRSGTGQRLQNGQCEWLPENVADSALIDALQRATEGDDRVLNRPRVPANPAAEIDEAHHASVSP